MAISSVKIFEDTNMFYFYNNCIYSKNLNDEKISDLIINNVSKKFYVCKSKNTYLLCHDLNKNLVFLKYENDVWQQKILANVHNISEFYMYMKDDILTLIYAIENDENNIEQLIVSKVQQGEWANPLMIDNIISFAGIKFKIYHITDVHVLIFYRRPDGFLIYDEMDLNSLKKGTKVLALQTSNNILDFSAIIYDDMLHMAFIINSQKTYKIVYKNKVDGIMSEVKNIYQGSVINNVLIFKIKGYLWITWISNDKLYYTYSTNNGSTFKTPSKYNNVSYKNLIKAKNLNGGNKNVLSTEIYVDALEEKKASVLDDISNNYLQNIEIQSVFDSAKNNDKTRFKPDLKDESNDDIKKIYVRIDALEKNCKIESDTIKELQKIKVENKTIKEKLSKLEIENKRMNNEFISNKQADEKILLIESKSDF